MDSNSSVRFFDAQFQRQVREAEFRLNPFEQAALPYLRGRVLDYGCGLGNLAVAAAQRGCSVLALDASRTAIEHLRRVAEKGSLSLVAEEADLRTYELHEEFDTIVCIGLLMFLDCPAAFRQLRDIQSHVRPGGVAIINVLVEGTTYLDMFDPKGYCLFPRDEMHKRFLGWELLHSEYQDFPAPKEQVKSFLTLVAKRPQP